MKIFNKSNLFYLSLIFFLIIILFNINYKKSSQERFNLTDFAIEDTSKINKIILTSKDESKSILKKIDKKWYVNDNYDVNKTYMEYLLKTIKRMRISYPISNSLRENVIGNLMVYGIKVDVFIDNKIVKTIFVGKDDKNLTATFMMLKGAKDPYAVHIPGFNGFLSSRFITEELIWRNKKIFQINSSKNLDYIYKNISNISKSIQIKKIDDSVSLIINENNPFKNFDNFTLKKILYFTDNIYCEAYLKNQNMIDSLIKENPMYEIIIYDNLKNSQQTLKIFDYNNSFIDKIKNKRFYGILNNRDLLVIQQRNFKNIQNQISRLFN